MGNRTREGDGCGNFSSAERSSHNAPLILPSHMWGHNKEILDVESVDHLRILTEKAEVLLFEMEGQAITVENIY